MGTKVLFWLIDFRIVNRYNILTLPFTVVSYNVIMFLKRRQDYDNKSTNLYSA